MVAITTHDMQATSLIIIIIIIITITTEANVCMENGNTKYHSEDISPR